MSILFITHDLGVVANIADEIVVLYRGRVMERGPTPELLRHPQHPYLKALLRAVPRLHTDRATGSSGLREAKMDGSLALDRSDEEERTGRTPGGAAAGGRGPAQDLPRPPLRPARRRARGDHRRRRCLVRRSAAARASPWSARAARGKTTVSKLIMRAAEGRHGPHHVLRSAIGRSTSCALDESRAARVPPPHPVHLPGPVRLAQPAHDGARHRGRAARHPRHRHAGPSGSSG